MLCGFLQWAVGQQLMSVVELALDRLWNHNYLFQLQQLQQLHCTVIMRLVRQQQLMPRSSVALRQQLVLLQHPALDRLQCAPAIMLELQQLQQLHRRRAVGATRPTRATQASSGPSGSNSCSASSWHWTDC